MRLNGGFLLVEVLVALVVFSVMVGAFGWFINVWLQADAEQRARNNAITQACNVLEGSLIGRVGEDQWGTLKYPKSCFVEALIAKQLWIEVPLWVGQLKYEECPRCYRAMVKEKTIVVQVNG